jgi:hypothetical protein
MIFLNLFRSRVYREQEAQRARLFRARATYDHAKRLYDNASNRQDTRAMSDRGKALRRAHNELLAAEMGR